MKSGFFYINGVSLTKFIDIKKQNVSYQNENSTYQDIVDKAIQEYNFPGMTYIWTEQSRSKKVGRFLLQFQETDWEFIKRVASIENLGLIPNMTGKQTQFFIGLPKGREEKIVPYCKHKVHRLLEKAEKEVVNNKVNTIWQGDYIQYELYDITEHYELGDVVRFQDMQYIVIEKISTLFKKDGILRNNYVIQQKKGIAFPRLYNNALRGNSLTGTVIDVKRNFTKLHLHIDEEQQDIATAFWFTQPQCFTAGSDSGFCIMPERGDTMRLHFPTKDETEHYIICSDNGDFSKLLSSLNASKGGKQPEKTAKVSGSNAPYEKFLTTPGQKGMLLNDGMVKYHTTGDISSIQMEDGKGISISSDGNIELLANNINLKAGAKLNITAGKKIEISCIGSSMIIDGEGDRIDKKAPDIFFDSPENVIVDVPVDAIEQLFASHAAERKAAVLEFTPDEIRITAENKFDDGIYQLLYDVWKETSGEYDPKDDKPIVDPRGNVHTQNETKFKYWAMEQYGMTAEEYRGYTVEGTLKTLEEIDMAKDKVMLILALPSMVKNAVKTTKDFANGVPFDASIGFAAGNDGRRQAQNIAEDVAEGNIKNEIKKNIIQESTEVFTLSKNNIQHFRKHTFDGMAEQAKYLTDENLAKKLKKTTFFNKDLSEERIIQYTQEAYNILRSQGKTGLNSIEVNGEIINVCIKADGTFDTAYGIYKYDVKDFR